MIEKSKLNNKSIAIIAVDVDSKEKDNVVVYSGSINIKGKRIYFHRNGNDLFEITDWKERINIVEDKVKKILLDCEYSLTLSISDVPGDENPEDYENTGLKWISSNNIEGKI